MSREQYHQIAELVSRIRNARFGEMVKHLEELIETGVWQDFTTPVGTHFAFRACEFDYFLAAQEIDATVVRWAYLKAEGIDGLAAKQFRLADITGRGRQPKNGDRRDPEEVARIYDPDPSGAGKRIRQWTQDHTAIVTPMTARIATDEERRAALEAGHASTRTPPGRKRWQVEWSDDRSAPEAIVTKLLADPELAHAVYKKLHSRVINDLQKKQRSKP